MDPSLQAALGPRYELRRQVARSRMGRVFEAWDSKHERAVAVKLAAQAEDPAGIARFREEISTVARLHHPSILPLYDSGEVDGIPYFVMPFVEARSLRDHLSGKGSLRLDEALPILVDLAGALDHAHDHGVIHRDVKPSNVLMESGRAVLTDFGVARLARLPDEQPDSGGVYEGSLRYMSPERMTDPHSAEPSSDVYGLACVTYELLTGERPFDGKTRAGVLARKLQGPEGVGAGLSALPKRVRAVVSRSLAVDPGHRHASPGAFVADLRRAMHRPRRVASYLAAGMAGVILLGLWQGWMPTDTTSSPEGPLIAVGPVQNRTGDPEFDLLVGAVVDYLTRSIQREGLVRAVPTEVALATAEYLDSIGPGSVADPVAALSEETGANLIVSGALVRGPQGIGFRAELSAPLESRVITSLEPVFASVGPTDDPAPLLEEAAALVLGALGVETDENLQGFAGTARPPTYAAYRTFSAGLDEYLTGDYRAAVPLFSAAHREDPLFVTAILHEAVSQGNLRRFSVEDSLLQLADALQDRMTVVERSWLAYRRALLAGRNAEALSAIRQAAAYAPRSRVVYNLATETMEGRRLEESVEALESLPANRGAMRGFPNHLALLAATRHLLGRHEEALAASREARELFPEHLDPWYREASARLALGQLSAVDASVGTLATLPPDVTGLSPGEVLVRLAAEYDSHGYPDRASAVRETGIGLMESMGSDASGDLLRAVGGEAYLFLGEAYLAAGRAEDAYRVAADLNALDLGGIPGAEILGLLGRATAGLGERALAERVRADLLALDEPYLFGGNVWAAAMISVELGETERALELLRRAFSSGMPYGEWVHNHMAFKPLWEHHEYQALVAPIG